MEIAAFDLIPIFSNTLIVIITSSAAVIGLISWRWWQQKKKYSSLRSLPSPKGNWLLGNAPQLLAAANENKFSSSLSNWANELGSMYILWFINRPFLILTKPRVIEKIIVEGHKDGTVARDPELRELWGNLFGGPIMIQQEGSEWQWRRQTYNRSFTSSHLSGYFEIVERACLQVVETLQGAADKQKVILVDPLFAELTMRIICRLMLGIPLDRNSPNHEGPPLEPQKLYEALSVLTKQFNAEAAGENKWFKYIPTKPKQSYWAAKRFLQEFVSPRVDLALQVAGCKQPSSAEVSSLFEKSILVQLAKQPKFNQQMLCAETIGIIFAGTDTTAHTLSFTVGALGINPRVYQLAQQEVDQVWQLYGGINSKSLKELTYLQGIIKESMRLYPVSNGSTACVTTRDTVIDGVDIPEGTSINWSLLAAGRDPEEYQMPDEFLPERWFKDQQRDAQPLTILVFGSGPHRCLGESLAMLEATVMLALLLRYFNWEIVNGRRSLEQLGQNLTVFPQDWMPVRFKVRERRENS